MGLLRLGLGAFHKTDTTRFGFGLDLLRLGTTGGAISSVLRLLGDQLLLAACEFGCVAEHIQIGRASRRERVCQYESISGVEVTLKTNNYQDCTSINVYSKLH